MSRMEPRGLADGALQIHVLPFSARDGEQRGFVLTELLCCQLRLCGELFTLLALWPSTGMSSGGLLCLQRIMPRELPKTRSGLPCLPATNRTAKEHQGPPLLQGAVPVQQSGREQQGPPLPARGRADGALKMLLETANLVTTSVCFLSGESHFDRCSELRVSAGQCAKAAGDGRGACGVPGD